MMKAGWNTLTDPYINDPYIKSEYKHGKLKNILLTTFDAADTELLVSELLPEWLGVKRRISEDNNENNCFLIELDNKLKSLDNAVIISSTTLQKNNQPYPWLWGKDRFIPIRVGKKKNAVQHAKLWMFHRSHQEEVETLEICISSANLTRAGFKDQTQAAWRCVLELNKRESEKNLNSWGILPDFITELGNSSGKTKELKPFIDILRQAACPQDVSFVASVPGTHQSNSKWGRYGLKGLMPKSNSGVPKVTILCPTVGTWNNDDLTSWFKLAGCKTNNFTLGWISKDTANNYSGWKDNWILPQKTVDALNDIKCNISEILLHENGSNLTPYIHEEHRPIDKRWLHAKIYGFACGKQYKVLITSANFSTSAWGHYNKTDNSIFIHNFELGVVIAANISDVYKSRGVLEPDNIHISETKNERNNSIWAEATWDGNGISIAYRLDDLIFDIAICAVEKDGSRYEKPSNLQLANRGEENIQWSIKNGIPTDIKLSQKDQPESVFIPILNMFDSENIIVISERIALKDAQEIRDSLLFEKYGIVLLGNRERKGGENGSKRPPSADFKTEWLKACRRWTGVVDSWIQQGNNKKDGECLIEAMNRQLCNKCDKNRIGLTMAIDEIKAWLKGDVNE